MLTGFIMFAGTIVVYVFMKKLYQKLRWAFLVPVATSTFLIVCCLLAANEGYHAYMTGGKWIDLFLGPAVVALAYPLYEQWETLKKQFTAIIAAVFTGAMIGILSGLYLSIWFKINPELIRSLISKSVTSPVSMDIARLIHGIPSLAAVYVMAAGISGSIFGPFLLKTWKVRDQAAIGVGLGSAAHGIGTAKSLEYGEEAGAVSSVAMTLSAVFASVLCPVIVSSILGG
ncbi:LrgB family protein [Metabacillus sp. RGM 3146]|uniref:LrgB family protein n=1 Tax=Metabacillus sp. RGM 3146 TaxID=3401092 RepID=UPI003B9DA119